MDKYILLQALGLKPTKSKYYASPIESCGINTCTHFNKMDDNFIQHLTNNTNNIKCIAHGHKHFCCPIPLLYSDTSTTETDTSTTQEKQRINVISCDTSNGNRIYPELIPEANFKLENVPLAIIYKDSAGITSINEDGHLTTTDEIKKAIYGVYKINKDTKDYIGMINVFNFGKTFPSLLKETDGQIKRVQYPDGFFQLNGHGNNASTMYIPSTFEPPKDYITEGGKRKTRRHKITKNKNKRNKKGKTLRNKRRTIRKR
jgi:hypothetical protein